MEPHELGNAAYKCRVAIKEENPHADFGLIIIYTLLDLYPEGLTAKQMGDVADKMDIKRLVIKSGLTALYKTKSSPVEWYGSPKNKIWRLKKE